MPGTGTVAYENRGKYKRGRARRVVVVPRGAYKLGRAKQVERKLVDLYLRKLQIMVREAMAERDIGASALFAATGITRATISRLLRGRKVPRVDTIIALALAMDMLPSELLP